MKRTCPACRKQELYWKIFAFHQVMKCIGCGHLFKYSLRMRLANFLTLMLLPLANFIFFGNMLILIPVIVVQFGLVILIAQYLPVKPSEPIEHLMLAPTDVKFEKTDSVTENIRRYRAAQQKAIKSNIS
ncbi:hypothetical protein ACUR5C_08140 [Aliikangiella sp. IMCC44653]